MIERVVCESRNIQRNNHCFILFQLVFVVFLVGCVRTCYFWCPRVVFCFSFLVNAWLYDLHCSMFIHKGIWVSFGLLFH